MWPILEEAKVFNIKDIYDFCDENNLKMLSNYNSDFWKPYVDHSADFDRTFKRRYRSFFPYDQEPGEDIAEVAVEFIQAVSAHLRINDKRYSELFRAYDIEDNDAYSLTNNVDYTEEYGETNSRDITFNKGVQIDSDNGYTAYGERIDTEDLEFTKGEEIDTEDLSTTYGAQDVDTTNSTSAYNGSTFSPVDKSEVENGSHEDTQDNSRTSGQRIDSEDNSRTYGAHRDDVKNTHNEGAREDTTGETGAKDYLIHKVGNMGVQTVDDMLLKHWDNWKIFSFYDMVFSEIANEILRGA